MPDRTEEWIEEAIRKGHDFVVCCGDSFDNSYYPIYCNTKTEAEIKRLSVNRQSMQRVFEVIDVRQTDI